MAVRLDGQVQASAILFQIPGDVLWRHYSLITLDKLSTSPMQTTLPVTRPRLPTMPDATLTNRATKCALPNSQHTIPPTQVALAPKAPMTPPLAFKDSTSKPAWTVYIKCLPQGVSADVIRADFNADGIEMEGGLTATLLFGTKQMAEEAITWNRTMYHGRRIELKWSTRRCWLWTQRSSSMHLHVLVLQEVGKLFDPHAYLAAISGSKTMVEY